MTEIQLQFYQELKTKHTQLFRKIMEQQKELRAVQEELLQYTCIIVPITDTDRVKDLGGRRKNSTIAMSQLKNPDF